MDGKAKTLLGLSTLLLFSCASVQTSSSVFPSSESAIPSSEESLSSEEELSSEEPTLPTSFSLSASNGAFLGQSYTGQSELNERGKIDGNAIYPMEGYCAISSQNAYCKLRKEDGFISSKAQANLVSIKVSFLSDSPIEVRLYPSDLAGEYESRILEKSGEIDATSFLFFSIHATFSTATIQSIEVAFLGDYSYQPTPVVPSDLPYEGDIYKAEDIYREDYSYKAIMNSAGGDVIDASSGRCENFLVIPIELSDYPFSDSTLDDLDPLFNGKGKEDTGYWESLSSYYSKASFGIFNPHFEIADKFELGLTAAELANHPMGNGIYSQSQIPLRRAVEDYREKYGNEALQDFDGDGDGLLDGVIMIYSCPDYSRSRDIAKISTDLYWAFCFWDTGNYGYANPAKPIANAYFWASYDFNYEAVRSPKVDAHTLIHEFGHMLGLDDYYSYDENRSPAGGGIMMDHNIGDHDIFSKLALGWVDPYVVSGEATVTIKPSYSSGEAVILAPHWNGTAFDEYLVMELYVPEGLNEQDAKTSYPGRYKLPSEPGIRMYHVDSRVSIVGGVARYIDDPDSYRLRAGENLSVTASNSANRRIGEAAENKYDHIRLIKADCENNMHGHGWPVALDRDFFHDGDYFLFEEFSEFFPKETTLNNAESIDLLISFDEITSESATITFTYS